MRFIGFGIIIAICCQSWTIARLFCPPPNVILNANRTTSSFKTAILAEIHGGMYIQTLNRPMVWTNYFSGDRLARNLYLHVGVLGVDKVYLTVFYNSSFARPPRVEDIYPPSRYCVVDWYRLGVLEWRPLRYGGPISTWPTDEKGVPTLERDWYKSTRGYIPIYEEIRNHTDWVFVVDLDEELMPVNLDLTDRPTWCYPDQPSLISRTLQQMQVTATRHMLKWWNEMMKYHQKHMVLDASEACPMGYSGTLDQKCMPVANIFLPVYLWLVSPNSPRDSLPTVRSKLPCQYGNSLRAVAGVNRAEEWKAVYQTRYTPQLVGKCIHENYAKPRPFTILAPRQFHGGLSLELMHQRAEYQMLPKQNVSRMMTSDYRFVQLTDSYHNCMLRLSVEGTGRKPLDLN